MTVPEAAQVPPIHGLRSHDDVIVGGGHNGLVAAACLARTGRTVLVLGSNPNPACSPPRRLRATPDPRPAMDVARFEIRLARELCRLCAARTMSFRA
jgi:2-polyprenyl-6-methoxyphenol hydroxylase-like FAD-dependent oxidoreductase